MVGRSTRTLEVIGKSVARIQSPVARNTRAVAIVYGAWCLFWVVGALVNIGELRISAHLALAFTGMPLALASLYMPNASMGAIITAAVLGLAQWAALVAWWSTDEPKGE